MTNLYSNVPYDLGLAAIKHWIDGFPNFLYDRFPKEFVLKSQQSILQNNEMVYRQKLSTAMGTKVSPTYATLVLGFLEQKLYFIAKENIRTKLAHY